MVLIGCNGVGKIILLEWLVVDVCLFEGDLYVEVYIDLIGYFL